MVGKVVPVCTVCIMACDPCCCADLLPVVFSFGVRCTCLAVDVDMNFMHRNSLSLSSLIGPFPTAAMRRKSWKLEI